jgi:hypothetical protein
VNAVTTRPACRAPLLPLLLLLPPLVPAAAGPQAASTAKVASASPVVIMGESLPPKVRDVALAIAQKAWQETSTLYGSADESPPPTREIHLDRSVAEYEAACDRLGLKNLKRNLAFSEWTTCVAHVVLQPVLASDAFTQIAPTFPTLCLVAHETTHLARLTLLPNNARSHPEWLADGGATWIETKALAANLLLATPERVPWFAKPEVDAQRMARREQLPTVDALVHDRTDTLAFYDRYAARYLLFRHLVEGARAKAFREFLGDVRQLGGGSGFVDRSAEALAQHLGIKKFAEIDDEFRAFIEGLKPEWDEQVRSLSIQGDEWTQCAFDDANAVAFRTAPAGAKRYAIEGEVTTVADRNAKQQANVLLGRVVTSNDSNLFVSVAIVPGDSVTIFSFDATQSGADQWKRLGLAKTTETAGGKPIRFAVECEPQGRQTRVAVRLAGRAILEVTADRPLDGPWGVGVQHGCSCIWKGVRQTAGASR